MDKLFYVFLGVSLALAAGWSFSGLAELVDDIHEREE